MRLPGPRRAVRRLKLIVSCEHGGNRVPPEYAARFAGRTRLLHSHRGFDPGALVIARDFARALGVQPHFSTVSRLVVDLNRSPHHPRVFSAATRALPGPEREKLLQRYYCGYRAAIEHEVQRALAAGACVVHLSCHSFTPRMNGKRRRADIGLLYDPRSTGEADLCRRWQERLGALVRLRVRRNYPYRGYADGLTTSLRRRFGGRGYLGIELEVNQRIARRPPERWRRLRGALVEAFAAALRDKGC